MSPTLFEGLLLLAVGGLVTWVFFLHNKVHAVQLQLAQNYHSKLELQTAIREALKPLEAQISLLIKFTTVDREQ